VNIKKLLLAGLMLLSSTVCYADTIDLDEVKIAYKQFFPYGYEPLINQNGMKDRELRKELSLFVNNNILTHGYFNNQILSYTDRDGPSQSGENFRIVGWNFELGIHLFDNLDVYYWHFSKHYLDTKPVTGRFPVQDAVGINLYLYRAKPKRDGIF